MSDYFPEEPKPLMTSPPISAREIVRRCDIGLANLRASRNAPGSTWGDLARNGRKIALLEARKWRALKSLDETNGETQ